MNKTKKTSKTKQRQSCCAVATGSLWVITVGGGYGTFFFRGTESEAEEMRRHKARWEGAVARKRPATAEEETANNRGDT